MTRFEIRLVGPAWEVRRDRRIVCYFSSRDQAGLAVAGYVREMQAAGKPAEFHIFESSSVVGGARLAGVI